MEQPTELVPISEGVGVEEVASIIEAAPTPVVADPVVEIAPVDLTAIPEALTAAEPAVTEPTPVSNQSTTTISTLIESARANTTEDGLTALANSLVQQPT